MNLTTQVTINSSKEKVWQVVTDIENSVNTISGIEEVEILERPAGGLVGLKWKETRTLFGKKATEIMWITEARENEYYKVRAESHGAIYLSTIAVNETDGKTLLSMHFTSVAQTFGAKVMSFIFGFMFKNATKKALQKDLDDIKTSVESR